MPSTDRGRPAAPTIGQSLRALKRDTDRGKLSELEVQEKVRDWPEKLAAAGCEPRDVAAAVEAWKIEWFPASFAILEAAVGEARDRREAAEREGRPGAAETFAQRCARLGRPARVLAGIGHTRWQPLADSHAAGTLDDAALADALDRLASDPDVSFRSARRGQDTRASALGVLEDVRELETRPDLHQGRAPALAFIGRAFLGRAVREGRLTEEELASLGPCPWDDKGRALPAGGKPP